METVKKIHSRILTINNLIPQEYFEMLFKIPDKYFAHLLKSNDCGESNIGTYYDLMKVILKLN